MHHQRARQNGLQDNSFASEFHHVRLQTPGPSSDQGNERSKRACRPTISPCAEPHPSYDRQKIRNGILSERIQASNGLMDRRVEFSKGWIAAKILRRVN